MTENTKHINIHKYPIMEIRDNISVILVVIGNIYTWVNVRDKSILANIAKINPNPNISDFTVRF